MGRAIAHSPFTCCQYQAMSLSSRKHDRPPVSYRCRCEVTVTNHATNALFIKTHASTIPSLETLRYRVKPSVVQTSDSDDNNTRQYSETPVRRGTFAVRERLTGLALQIHGRRAAEASVASGGGRTRSSSI
jgi:hypothetical protein